jgi:LPS O-antigen subunit length determinant protein (WzzB/FepE family)
MKNNNTEQNYYQEDEIDLKELFNTLWFKKNLIIGITATITILAGIYAFNKTPIYEATALVEIGNYKLHNNNNNNNNNNKASLDSANELVKKLNILFIDMLKNEKDRKFEITSISTPKKVNNFVEIKAEAISNELASQQILKVVSYIKNKHQKILDDVTNRRELEIKNIETKIYNIKNKEVKLLTEKINIQQANLDDYKLQLNTIGKNIKDIENSNPALTALKLMEKRDLSSFILELNLQLMDMRNKKDELQTTSINQLFEKKQLVASMMLPHNYKNSEIVGQVITNDYPAKPKKKPIVAVAFIAGFILSIFLVFIMNAFRKEDDRVSA